MQSRRKVSSLSDRSDTSEQGMISGGEESPGILSDDQQPESPTDSNENDDTAKNMPWLKAIIDLMSSYNYYCTHKGYCHPFCYKRHMRSCTRLVKATRKVRYLLRKSNLSQKIRLFSRFMARSLDSPSMQTIRMWSPLSSPPVSHILLELAPLEKYRSRVPLRHLRPSERIVCHAKIGG